MNIGRRYQVAVEANGVQQRATAARNSSEPRGRACQCADVAFQSRACGIADCGLRWREGCGVLMFAWSVESRVVFGWLVDGNGSEEDDSVDTRRGGTDWMTEAAVHETASTHGLACGKQRRDDRWTRCSGCTQLCPKVEGCAQHLGGGIPVALPASAKPLAREKSERIEKCLHRNLLGKRCRCLLPSNYMSCFFSYMINLSGCLYSCY